MVSGLIWLAGFDSRCNFAAEPMSQKSIDSVRFQDFSSLVNGFRLSLDLLWEPLGEKKEAKPCLLPSAH